MLLVEKDPDLLRHHQVLRLPLYQPSSPIQDSKIRYQGCPRRGVVVVDPDLFLPATRPRSGMRQVPKVPSTMMINIAEVNQGRRHNRGPAEITARMIRMTLQLRQSGSLIRSVGRKPACRDMVAELITRKNVEDRAVRRSCRTSGDGRRVLRMPGKEASVRIAGV